ncbi:hypothetical protein FKM82_030209 [Ascaphus truei]
MPPPLLVHCRCRPFVPLIIYAEEMSVSVSCIPCPLSFLLTPGVFCCAHTFLHRSARGDGTHTDWLYLVQCARP